MTTTFELLLAYGGEGYFNTYWQSRRSTNDNFIGYNQNYYLLSIVSCLCQLYCLLKTELKAL